METPEIVDLPPDAHPFYTKNEDLTKQEADRSAIPLIRIPQGPGSKLEADRVDGLEAVTSDKAGPNVLVATDSTGKLPTGAIPGLADLSGAWSTWSPTWGGFSVSPTVGAYYVKIGKTVICQITTTGHGTSNATSLTFTLPFTSSKSLIVCGTGLPHNNGAFSTNPIRIDVAASSATATVYRTLQGDVWTNSGAKSFYGFLVYEAV